MLSRRLLRVKVIQCLYASMQKGETKLAIAEQELMHSLAKSYELYHVSLSILIELRNYHIKRTELLRKKHLATAEDKNPNTRFLQNKLFNDLEVALERVNLTYNFPNIFTDHPEVVDHVYKQVIISPTYNDYIALGETDYDTDRTFMVKIIDKVIAQNLQLYSFFEDMSVYWNDESEFIFSMAMKTLKSFKEDGGRENQLIEEFKDPDDKEFTIKLFRKAFVNNDEYRKLISIKSKNWEVERVSLLDIIIMQSAINEVVEIAQVPVNVTLNEYIEIAKYYSSEKSGTFINGILDKIFINLEEEKKIVKMGRGLITK